jgi:hypothetical protein
MAAKTEKSIIYHIPKCGGIWVKEAVRRSGVYYDHCRDVGRKHPFGLAREHAPPSRIKEEDKVGRFSFCFVRHPVDWYKSFWAYRAKTGWLDKKFLADKCWEDEFELFVLNMLDMYPDGFVTELYQFYLWEMEFIGRQERLVDDLVKALMLADEEFDEEILRRVGWRNIAGKEPRFQRLCVLSNETQDRILETERWVIDRFYGTDTGH